MIDSQKEQEAEEMLDQLSKKMDNGEMLNNWEEAMFDTLSWLLFDSDKPEID